MRHLLIAAATAAVALSTPALAADVGVSVSIGQPGFYGRIDIGGYPPPDLIYANPRMVQMVPRGRPPLYLHVPPGHAKNWRKHCHAYNACGEQVYFVQNSWYSREYVPRYQERHHHSGYNDGYRDGYRDEHRSHRRDDDRHGDHDRGHGNKHKHGHDHKHDH